MEFSSALLEAKALIGASRLKGQKKACYLADSRKTDRISPEIERAIEYLEKYMGREIEVDYVSERPVAKDIFGSMHETTTETRHKTERNALAFKPCGEFFYLGTPMNFHITYWDRTFFDGYHFEVREIRDSEGSIIYRKQ